MCFSSWFTNDKPPSTPHILDPFFPTRENFRIWWPEEYLKAWDTRDSDRGGGHRWDGVPGSSVSCCASPPSVTCSLFTCGKASSAHHVDWLIVWVKIFLESHHASSWINLIKPLLCLKSKRRSQMLEEKDFCCPFPRLALPWAAVPPTSCPQSPALAFAQLGIRVLSSRCPHAGSVAHTPLLWASVMIMS